MPTPTFLFRQHRTKGLSKKLSVLAFVLLVAAPLSAEDSESAKPQNSKTLPDNQGLTEQTVQKSTPPATGRSAKPSANKNPPPLKHFKPSEEISEDFSVPFPVDI